MLETGIRLFFWPSIVHVPGLAKTLKASLSQRDALSQQKTITENFEEVELEVIFLKYTKWRKALETKNKNLGRLSNRYVTGQVG